GVRAGEGGRAGKRHGRRTRGQLGEAEPRQAERRAGVARDRAREIVGRAARGTDNETLGGRRPSAQERARGIEPAGGRPRNDDAHVGLLPDAMPETRDTPARRRRAAKNTTSAAQRAATRT